MKLSLNRLIAGAAFIALPFLFDLRQANPLRDGKVEAVVFLCGILISIYLYNYERKSLSFTVFLLFVNTFYTGFGAPQSYALVFILSILFVSIYLKRMVDHEFIFKWISISGLLVCTSAYLQVLGIESFVLSKILPPDFILHYAPGIDSHLPVAYLGQQTLFGAFIALTGSLCLMRKKYWWFLYHLPVAALTTSSFTIGALGVGVLVYCFRYWKLNTVIFSLIGFIALLMAWHIFPDADIFFAHGRYEIWETAASATYHIRPWLGFGGGTFDLLYHSNFEPYSLLEAIGEFRQAHNEYVNIYFEFGALGLISVLFLLLDMLSSFFISCVFENKENCWLAASVVFPGLFNAIGNFPMQLSPQNLIITLAIIILLTSTTRNDNITPQRTQGSGAYGS